MTSRQARFQASRLASGWSRPSLLISPEATKALEEACKAHGWTKVKVVEAGIHAIAGLKAKEQQS